MPLIERSRHVAACVAALVVACASATTVAEAANPKKACVAASTDAQTLRQEDKLIEARDKLRVCANDPCPSVVKTQCAHWLHDVEAQIPSVVVRAQDGAGRDVMDATVTLDGNPSAAGRPETVDAGPHVVVVTLADGTTKEEKFLVVDGEQSRVLLVTLPTAGAGHTQNWSNEPATSSGSRIPVGAWLLGGVGVAALATSAIFALVTKGDLNDLRKSCSPTCTSDETQSGRTHALVTDVALGIGVAAVAGAVIWGIVSSSHGGHEVAVKSAPVIDVRPVAGGAVFVVGGSY